MYNGIGLPTPRGSGTNGYVQRNLSFQQSAKEKVNYKTEADIKRADAVMFKEPNKEILEHDRKRKLELKCVEMEDLMEEQGYSPEEIQIKVAKYRQVLLEQDSATGVHSSDISGPDASVDVPGSDQLQRDDEGRLAGRGTHEIAAATALKNSMIKEALGIGENFEVGLSLRKRASQTETATKLVAEHKEMKIIETEEQDKSAEKKKKKRKKAKKHKHKRSHSEEKGSSDGEAEKSKHNFSNKKKRKEESSCGVNVGKQSSQH